MKNLEAQTAVISGGLGDIGRAIAFELAERGAAIALCDLAAPSDADRILTDLRERGVRACYGRVDVTDAAATATWVAAVEKELGPPTLIVPNAAQVTRASCQSITPAQWERELNVNLNGAFYLAQAAAQRLVERKLPGRIVFIGSWAAHRAHPYIPAYSVAKAGLRMLCQCMAVELAPAGIRVNEVAPGIVDAGLSGQALKRDPNLRAALQAMVPLQRLVEPRDVAQAVAFLCSAESHQVTGTALVLDGGLSHLPPQP
ncbi:MAG: oxidoreductase [Chloroflexota bacterium]|nr:MAG: oxidoreductase [Chloroflexota bacterium]